MRRLRAALVLGVVSVVVVSAAPARAQTAERIRSYHVAIAIDRSGVLDVTETIDYVFGSGEHHGIYRDIPDRLGFDDTYDRLYPIDVVSVDATGGASSQYAIEHEGGTFRIRIGDPDRTVTGEHTYTIEYRVRGALNAFADHDELYWNAIGADWDVPIDAARVVVTAPAAIQRTACFAGLSGSTSGCLRSSVDGSTATFAQKGMWAYQAFTVVVALPKGAIVPAPAPILEERWSLGRAFTVTPVTGALFAFLLVLAVGLFARMAWRTGRDRRFAAGQVDVVMGAPAGTPEQAVPLFESGGAPVEFAPPEDLRPGQIGTLMDEVANPLDVTATIVDLAVRKYLVIEEIPKHGLFGKPDWKLTQLRAADDDLLPFERRLLDGVFEDGNEVTLSSLKTKFVQRLHKVQDALYDDAVARGWFVGRPDRIRQRWTGIGVGILVVGGALEFAAVRWTKLGLIPVPVVLFGLLVAIGAHEMPRRTPKGTGLVRRVHGFRTVIATAETHMSRWAEQENVFTRYLPYAIVFGLTDKWAKAFAGLATPADTGWYVSSQPFVYADFGQAMDGFSTVAAGTIASTPGGSGGSGFGGGGGAGGGGGGGGGGSW
ncbi:MAG: DUF2207 domain-containing protein [Actinomycetota bacterium]